MVRRSCYIELCHIENSAYLRILFDPWSERILIFLHRFLGCLFKSQLKTAIAFFGDIHKDEQNFRGPCYPLPELCSLLFHLHLPYLNRSLSENVGKLAMISLAAVV